MKTIAGHIFEQLGGYKFITMTGSCNFVDIGNGMTMHLKKNKLKAKYLKIELNENDLYDLTFTKGKKVLDTKLGIKVDTLVVIEVINDIYDIQLQSIFTEKTGLLTQL